MWQNNNGALHGSQGIHDQYDQFPGYAWMYFWNVCLEEQFFEITGIMWY